MKSPTGTTSPATPRTSEAVARPSRPTAGDAGACGAARCGSRSAMSGPRPTTARAADPKAYDPLAQAQAALVPTPGAGDLAIAAGAPGADRMHRADAGGEHGLDLVGQHPYDQHAACQHAGPR